MVGRPTVARFFLSRFTGEYPHLRVRGRGLRPAAHRNPSSVSLSLNTFPQGGRHDHFLFFQIRLFFSPPSVDVIGTPSRSR